MARIFVSHSRRDRDIVNFFTEAFATSKKGVKADFMEFENMEGKDAGREIIQKIKDLQTQAVFVLLGPGVLKFRHTENWIAFEVGVCSGVEKDVWVFEPIRETVEFPIPYLNHYVPYRVGDKEEFAFLRHM